MISDEQILQAVENTRSQWAELLDKQEADDLGQWLVEAATGDPEAIRQTTNQVLELLQQHPQAQTHVSSELGIKGTLESFRGIYQPIPGGPDDIRPGTLMVCPKDPSHYRKRLRQKGQSLVCPEHGVSLVPANTLMVCPIDPSHYQKQLGQKGQTFFCPDHDVPLVRADLLGSK